jgi:hypothetical protein
MTIKGEKAIDRLWRTIPGTLEVLSLSAFETRTDDENGAVLR